MEESIYQQLYDFEIDQRVHLASTVNVPIVAVTALGSAAAAIALGYPFRPSGVAYVCAIALVCVLAALGLAIFFVFRSLIGYEYEKLPGPGSLMDHRRKLGEHFNSLLGPEKRDEADRLAQEKFDAGLELAFVRATEVNARNNRNRGNYVYRANICAAVATVFLAAAGIAYVVTKTTQAEEIHSVRIVGEVAMSGTFDPKKEEPKKEKPTESNTPAAPEFPPNEKHRDYTIDRPVTVVVPVQEGERR